MCWRFRPGLAEPRPALAGGKLATYTGLYSLSGTGRGRAGAAISFPAALERRPGRRGGEGDTEVASPSPSFFLFCGVTPNVVTRAAGSAASARSTYSDETVANREIRVWHFVIENGY